jgi:hypothetical protein
VAEWTIDDNGDLEFTDADGRLWTFTAAMLGDLVWTAETGQAATAVAALVADVRAARLADDMAAVVKAAEAWADTTEPCSCEDIAEGAALLDAVAALQRARREET